MVIYLFLKAKMTDIRLAELIALQPHSVSILETQLDMCLHVPMLMDRLFFESRRWQCSVVKD